MKRMEAAGVRLATLLNSVFADFDAHAPSHAQLPLHLQQSIEFVQRQQNKASKKF